MSTKPFLLSKLLVNYRAVAGVSILILILLAVKLNAGNEAVAISCAYDPESGQPNPLGMRAFITITETQGNTDFVYEQFPRAVAAGSPMTLAVSRTLTMHNTPIQRARSLMRENNEFYEALVGYKDTVGFSSYDEAMACRAATAKSNH